MAMTATGRDSEAESWDEFLASCTRGQFQQMSGWSLVKAEEGWSVEREWLEPTGARSGGFQLLWKHSRFARIGYVSKGPVLPEETETAVNAAFERLNTAARRLRLAAVVVQPPDDSSISSEVLVRHGFFSQPVDSVTRATAIFSLEGGADGVVSRLSRKVRQQWRNACRQGVTLKWGTRNDLALFFRLMCESCKRQGETPNPSSAALLEALWDAFPDRVWLAFAEHGGRALAGLLMIGQRHRIVFWKKGWDSELPHLYASQFLMTECLVWASDMGFASADAVSMSPAIAAKILSDEDFSEEQDRSRDIFNLRLGARPKFLPPAHLLIVDPLLRRVVYSGLRWKRLRNVLEQRIG